MAKGHNQSGSFTPKQLAFCKEYIIDFVGTQAAIRAGYSRTSAHAVASDLLKRADIKEEIKALLENRVDKYAITEKRILEEYAMLALARPFEILKDMVGNKITIKDLKDIPEELKPAIKGIKQTQWGVEVTFYDKTAALSDLGKYLGIFQKDNDQKKASGVAIYLPDNGRDVPPATIIPNDINSTS